MIEFQNVSIHFGTQEVLQDIRLQINSGERVGIVGPNGAGKSTLFSMITGELSPAKGSVVVPKNARLGYVRQQLRPVASEDSLLAFASDGVTGLRRIEARIHEIEGQLGLPENGTESKDAMLRELGHLQSEYEHAGGYDIESRAAAMLCGLGFSPDELTTPLSSFSGGWRMRAALARAIVGHPDILLLDEPSNYLDLPAIEWLQRFLRDFPGTLLLISHDRYLLRELTTTTVEVARTNVTRYQGGFNYYLQERELRLVQQQAAGKNQARKVEQAERFIERFRSKSSKASLVQSRIKQLAKMDRIDAPAPTAERALIRLAPPPRCGHEILRLEDGGLTYDGERWVLRHVNVRIVKGDRVALVGYNGMGKTSLLRIMSGQRAPDEGRCVLGHNVIMGYQSQEFAETMPSETSVMGIVQQRAGEQSLGHIRSVLGSFGFSGDDINKRCGILSGGEKIRLAFARLFVNPPNLLLLDEPTTHLDIAGREALEDALRSYEGTICFVSHDVDFVRGIATSIVELSPEGLRMVTGGYDYYREKLCGVEVTEAPQAENDGTSRKDQRRERARVREEKHRETRALKRRLASIESIIENFEAEKAVLVGSLEGGDASIDFAEMNRRLSSIESELKRYTDEWDAVTDELEPD